MSVQFGRWNFDGAPADPGFIDEVRNLLSPYSPDGVTIETADSLTLLFGGFHTTRESKRECQPYLSPSRDRIMWDGRLDIRPDCAYRLPLGTEGATDLEIVAAAYTRWGLGTFSRLIGDWAVSIWNASSRSLVLAKDFLGTRPLYYSLEDNRFTWSTILDPLIVMRKNRNAVCDEYIAGWLSDYPKASLTPYEGILSVPPASYTTVRPGEIAIREYWTFDPEKRVRYRNDREYEEHFLAEFRKSVARRMRSEHPALAELSGGMDSSSIVCVADRLQPPGCLEFPRLDTVSYYDDTEPNWDERPYFTRVEKWRGRAGYHIDASSSEPPTFASQKNTFFATPSSPDPGSSVGKQFSDCLASGGYRVLLSGIGGDEVTGGVPSPLPELADLLMGFEFRQLGRQLVAWSLAKKKPALHLLFYLAGALLPLARRGTDDPPWLHPQFARRNHAALSGYPRKVKPFGPLPSFQANMVALDGLRRQLGCTPMPCRPVYEKRYPFLDRDFLAYCYSIPREQLLRPHQRRSLLRRAMAGIVPDEILDRRRKAFVYRRLARTISAASGTVEHDCRDFASAALGIIEPAPFLHALHEAVRGSEVALVPLVRALALEQWLRSFMHPVSPDLPTHPSQVAVDVGTLLRGTEFLGREKFI